MRPQKLSGSALGFRAQFFQFIQRTNVGLLGEIGRWRKEPILLLEGFDVGGD